MTTAWLDISRIRRDGGTQHRVKLNDEVVAEYAEAYLEDKKLPPVDVTFDGDHYWLTDGFHRVAGAEAAGKKSTRVNVARGTHREAFLKSLGANSEHGLRRSSEDKRAAVVAALQDAEIAAMSLREIADICGVSHETVARYKKDQVKVVAGAPEAGAAIATKVKALPGGGVELSDCDSQEPAEEGSELSHCDSGEAATARDTTDQQPGSTTVTKPAVRPVGSLETIVQERDEALGMVAELQSATQELMDENAEMRKMLDATDAMAALQEENKKLRNEIRVMQEQMNGLQEEKNAAIRQANSWKRKAQAPAAA